MTTREWQAAMAERARARLADGVVIPCAGDPAEPYVSVQDGDREVGFAWGVSAARSAAELLIQEGEAERLYLVVEGGERVGYVEPSPQSGGFVFRTGDARRHLLNRRQK